MRIQSVVTAVAVLALTGSRVGAQAAHPDFSGTWVLDAAKTVMNGQLGAPTSATYTIRVHGDSIITDRVAEAAETGTIKSHIVWGTDGKTWKNTVPVNGTDTEISSVLSWQEQTLVVKTTLTVQETPVEQLDQWTLSSDGKTLSMQRSISAMGQELGTSTMFFVKKS
jgi:hypothetical protein